MRSIKPGRGPSMMGGITSIAVGIFGILWTVFAAASGGGFFALFGIVFVVIAVTQAVYNFKNATGENRYSEYDITDSGEEPDPFNERFGNPNGTYERWSPDDENSSFCPYCGTKLQEDFVYCNKCGKRLP